MAEGRTVSSSSHSAYTDDSPATEQRASRAPRVAGSSQAARTKDTASSATGTSVSGTRAAASTSTRPEGPEGPGRPERSARSSSQSRSSSQPATPSAHFPELEPSRAILRGALTSIIAFGLYALALFLFVSLFLLIASMEAGTDLGNVTSSFTGGLILLSQGLPVHTRELSLSIIPLGLTWLSMSVLRATFQRRRNTLLGDITSILTWTALTAGTAYLTSDILSAQPWQVAAYPALVAALAWVWSCASDADSPVYSTVSERIVTRYASATLRANLARGLRLARRIAILYVILATATIIAWIILGWSSMANVFTLTSMGLGSRITTTVLTLAWLPNFLIWALAWLFGATITIGTLGTFSLWIGQSAALPPLPVFGLLPEALPSDSLRTALLLIPVLLVALLGIWTLVARREYKLLKLRPQLGDLLDYLYPLGAFVVSILVTVTAFFVLISVSSGSLGSKNLAFLGIPASEALSAFGRPLQWGLLLAWLLVISIVLVQLGVIYGRAYLSARSSQSNSSDSSAHHVSEDSATDFPPNPTHTTEDTHEH